MKRLTIETPAVYGTGDLHGCFGELQNYIKIRDIEDCAIIVNGDIGLGFEVPISDKMVLGRLDRVCRKRRLHIILFRGNHDDPSRFKPELYPYLTNVHILEDYTVVTFDNGEETMNVLVVGGATSIDRTRRWDAMRTDAIKYMRYHGNVTMEEALKSVRQCYWKDEAMVFDSDALDEIQKEGIAIDCVATHTAPSFCFPHDKGGVGYYLALDKDLEQDLDNERAVADQIYGRLVLDNHPLKKWMYGHFHAHHNEEIDGVVFVMLDMVRNGAVDLQRFL